MKTASSYLFEKLKELPPELAEVVLNFDFTNSFDSLVNKYKLHYDQSEVIQNLTYKLMFEEITPSDFTQKLVNECSLIPVTAKELTDDVNLTIISNLKRLILQRVQEVTDMYETDDNSFKDSSNDTSPQPFHPKSAYNEPITNDAPIIHHLTPTQETKLTHSDILHGIENPHPSINFNSPIKTVSGAKSYSTIMAGSTTVKPVYPEPQKQPVIEIKPTPTPPPQQKVDLIGMKSTSVVVSSPNKIETLPAKQPENLPAVKTVDPYKETI